MRAQMKSVNDRFGRRVQIDEPISYLASHQILTHERSTSNPVAVYMSFVVSPSDARLWVETWSSLARVAETSPGCHSFRIVRDRNDSMFVAAISEWETVDAYKSFEHETQSMALEQAMGHVCMPSEARFLDVIPVNSRAATAV